MARSVSARVVQAFLGLVAFFGILVPGLWAQANVQGQWSTLSGSMSMNPVHTALLHNGKILDYIRCQRAIRTPAVISSKQLEGTLGAIKKPARKAKKPWVQYISGCEANNVQLPTA